MAAATEAVATGSFPNPSSNHSQQRQRPNYPPMRNESIACLRRRRSLRPTDGARAGRGRSGAGAAQATCTGRNQLKPESPDVGAHLKHVRHAAHACDARRVEAQRLVERQRSLSGRKERVCDARRGAGREAGEDAWGDDGASGMHGVWEGPTAGCGAEQAHLKHCAHGFHAGRVKAQRLVERMRVLRGAKRGGMQFGARCGPDGGRARGAGGGASGMHGEGPTEGWVRNAPGTCTACL